MKRRGPQGASSTLGVTGRGPFFSSDWTGPGRMATSVEGRRIRTQGEVRDRPIGRSEEIRINGLEGSKSWVALGSSNITPRLLDPDVAFC